MAMASSNNTSAIIPCSAPSPGLGLLHRRLPSLRLALRPVQAQGQRSGREDSPLPPLPALTQWLSHLLGLSEIVRKNLRPAHRRITPAFSGRQPTTKSTSLAARPALPTRHPRRG